MIGRLALAALIASSALLLPTRASAAEITVMISAGFSTAYRALVPEFERATGHTIVTIRGPSMGDRPEAVPNRIARGEPVDVVIVNADALDRLIAGGKLAYATRTDIAGAPIGAVVRAGARKPDLGTVEGMKRALLEAGSIAYSDSGSGVYLSTVLFPRLGIAEQIRQKSRMVRGSVAEAVARGESELGFQTMSELLGTPGVEQLGPIPSELQAIQTFSAAIATGAREPEAGLALIKYLSSPAAAPAIVRSGMVPASGR